MCLLDQKTTQTKHISASENKYPSDGTWKLSCNVFVKMQETPVRNKVDDFSRILKISRTTFKIDTWC